MFTMLFAFGRDKANIIQCVRNYQKAILFFTESKYHICVAVGIDIFVAEITNFTNTCNRIGIITKFQWIELHFFKKLIHAFVQKFGRCARNFKWLSYFGVHSKLKIIYNFFFKMMGQVIVININAAISKCNTHILIQQICQHLF